jgi:ribulose-phosphate 3-epimerase
VAAVLAPSILSADFARLGDEVKETEAGGAGVIHVDVMDGHFVPNISIGTAVAGAVRKVTQLPLDCHLMIEHPDRYIAEFVEAGADMISVHQEVLPHLHRTITLIRGLGAKAGVVLNPSTPLSTLDDILPIDRERLDVRIEIDGGVTEENLERVAAAGVDMIVAGSAVFGSGDVRATTERMVRCLAELAERERTC